MPPPNLARPEQMNPIQANPNPMSFGNQGAPNAPIGHIPSAPDGLLMAPPNGLLMAPPGMPPNDPNQMTAGDKGKGYDPSVVAGAPINM